MLTREVGEVQAVPTKLEKLAKGRDFDSTDYVKQEMRVSIVPKLLLVLYCVSTMTSGVPVQLTAVPSLHTSVDVVQPSLSPTQQVAG